MEIYPIVGGKNAFLGEMYRELASQRVKIPNGFVVTAEVYRYVIESARILDEIKDAMVGLDCVDDEPEQKRSQVIVSKEAKNAKRCMSSERYYSHFYGSSGEGI